MFELSYTESEAVFLSLKVALFAVGLSLPLGIFVAWVLARMEFPGKTVLDAIIHVPLVMPPVVVGYLLLLLLGRKGVMGSWIYDTFGVTIGFSWQGAAVAAAVMSFSWYAPSAYPSRRSIPTLSRQPEHLALDALMYSLVSRYHWLGAVLSLGLFSPLHGLWENSGTIFRFGFRGETNTLPLSLYTIVQTLAGTGAIRLVCLTGHSVWCNISRQK